ncbi:MAG: TonB-dependent receptor [Saprospiraceae bacterium]|nr:TonB-dependent receptor [Saprospiraceae bacterium]
MRYFSLLLLGLALSLNVFAQTTITGAITDENGEPLLGANVIITTIRKGATANELGRYEIKGVPSGEYQITGSYIGYESVKRTIVVDPEVERMIVNIQMKERAFDLQTLTISATRADEKTPVTYSNLDNEEIAATNLGQDVPFLLKWMPSTIVTSDAGTGVGYTGLWIRGSDPSRVNVTINGIPLNDSESQGVFWVDLPDFLSSTQDIQVQRGVGTSTNGASAFGASINLSTAKLNTDAYAAMGGTIGSFNTMKANVRFGTGLINDKFIVEGRLSRISSDGYIDRATADLESYYLSGSYVGKNSLLRLNIFSGHEITYQAWNGVPRDRINDRDLRTFNPSGTEKEGEPHDNEVDNYRQTHYQLLYDNQLNLNWKLNLAAHYTKGQGFFELYQGDEEAADYGLVDTMGLTTDLIERRWLDNDFYGATYALNYQSNDNRMTAALGGAYNIYKGAHFGEVIWARFAGDSEINERYYDNDAEKRDFNIYGKVNYEFKYGWNAYLDLQYRSIGYDFLGFNEQLQNVEQSVALNFFNPKAGVFFELNDNTQLYASFGVAHREPNRTDFTESTPNSRPVAEQLLNTELGYRQSWNKGALGVNVYHMFYNDQLALTGQVNDVGEYGRVNIDKSYRLGLELVGGVEIFKNFNINANATFSQNKVEEFVEFVDSFDESFNYLGQERVVHTDTDLPFSPDISGMLELEYQLLHSDKQRLGLSLSTKYVGQQFIDLTSDEDNALDPYTFTDLRVNYSIQTGFLGEVSLTFLARNIFDSLYETNAWSYRYLFDGNPTVLQGFFPQAGRNFLFGVNVAF